MDYFLEPKTTQYGSHMVMTNVSKPAKLKFITMDTKFSDDYQTEEGWEVEDWKKL